MTAGSAPQNRHFGVLLAGLLAIPFLSVTTATLVADVASTTDPRAAVIGIPATLIGLAIGLCVLRLARVAHDGAVAVCGALVRSWQQQLARTDLPAATVLPRREIQPSFVFVPAATGRRGPPFSSR
ncbi:MAG: hypothetical protein R2695_08995 [Acidimicrobiales bacterium]